MGGPSGPQTTTQQTSTQLSPDQQQLMSLAMPSLQKYAANPTTVPTSGLVAPFTGPQTTGQNQVLGVNPTQQNVVGSGAQASQFLTGGAALDPSTNPAEAAQIRAATLPIEQQLTEGTLPALREQATGVGQTGSSREGVAEGIASRGASQAEGATAANIANTDYQNALDQMTKALALTPSTAAAQAIPGATTSAVGDTQQQQQQQNIDAQLMAQLYNSQQPLATGEALAGIASGIPGASTTSTGTMSPSSPSTLQQILGLGGLGVGVLGAGGTSGLGGALGKLLMGGGGASALAPAGVTGAASDLLPLLLA
jgi:hypothetical protein